MRDLWHDIEVVSALIRGGDLLEAVGAVDAML